MAMTSLFPYRPVTAVGYRSHESGQTEKYIYKKSTDTNYHLVYTVPAGVEFYLSAILMDASANSYLEIATGDAGAEVEVFSRYFTSGTSAFMSLPIPMRFTIGTKISVKASAGTDARFTLVGWTE